MVKNLRVLVFSAAFGMGHVRSAEAVIAAIRKKHPAAEIIHLDCGELISKRLNTVLKTTYLGLIKYTPKLWGKFYYGTSRISPDSIFQRFLNKLGQNGFKQYIDLIHPDLIICTYPTVAGVLAELRQNNLLDVPVITVITDFAVHSQWIHQGVDLFIVGCKEVFKGLVSRGISPNRIRTTGIPVGLEFEDILSRKTISAKLGLLPNRLTILVMGGAYGTLGAIKGVCKTLADENLPLQLIVVCGKDEKLYKSLDNLINGVRNPITLFGFSNNVEELMTVSDIVITKAGGLTVSEALTKRLPLIIYKPIPGQEEENAKFLSKVGAGKTANSIEELVNILHHILDHPAGIEKMRQAAAMAIPGHAAERAVEFMLELIGQTGKDSKDRMIG